jgi:hypothetical protein
MRISFKTKRGRRVTFTTGRRSKAAVSASRRARGKALARKYGFIRKAGAIYAKRPGRAPKLIRRIKARRTVSRRRARGRR